MSSNARPSKSRLWVDGDAFRAPAGTPLPAGNVIPTGQTLFTAATFTGWEAFGGIKQGFEIPTTQESSDLTIWNAEGAYRKKKEPPITKATMRPVDESVATVLTVLQGGSISETALNSDVWEWVKGDDEEFAMLLIARDPGHGARAYYAERTTLDNPPSEQVNGDDLAGYDLALTFLTPDSGGLALRTFSDTNPLAP